MAFFQFHWMDSSYCACLRDVWAGVPFQFHWMDSALAQRQQDIHIYYFQFHWMDSYDPSKPAVMAIDLDFQFHWMDSVELRKLAPSRGTTSPFNSIEWIRWNLERYGNMGAPFNSIEWIRQLFCSTASPESRACFQFHWMDSYPYSWGFYCLECFLSFNSIEWIRRHRGAQKPSRATKAFNSIEWIPPFLLWDVACWRQAPFNSIEWIPRALKQLYEEAGDTFNSIEWIRSR